MLCIPFWNGYFNVEGTKEDSFPYVTKLEKILELYNS